MTVVAVDRVCGIIFISTESTSLFANCKFSDLELFLVVFKSHHNIGVDRMVVLLDVLISVRGTEAIEAFHAYKKAMLIFLKVIDKLLVRGSI